MKRAPLALGLCLCLGGCIGVTRVPERTRGQQGPTSKIDLSFLDTPQVTRDEVLEKLKPADTGFKSDHYFIGRWDTSKWGGWAFLCGYVNCMGGTERFWHTANLVVEFDDNGDVKQHELFTDKYLFDKLQPLSRDAKWSPADHLDISISRPRMMDVPINVSLLPQSMEFTQTNKVKKPLHFTAPSESLVDVHSSMFCASQTGPVYITWSLQFDRNLKEFDKSAKNFASRGNRLCLNLSVPELLTLVRYVSDHGAKGPHPTNKRPLRRLVIGR